jgi:hypothetical protein
MSQAVYILCAATALACAVLLLRSYLRNHTRLLLWSGLCFVGLALNNALLFIDLVVVPTIDLSLWRGLSALAGLLLLIYGLVGDSK